MVLGLGFRRGFPRLVSGTIYGSKRFLGPQPALRTLHYPLLLLGSFLGGESGPAGEEKEEVK